MSDPPPARAPRNRTLTLSAGDYERYRATLTRPPLPASLDNAIVHGDTFALSAALPHCFADLLFLDPPYNLNREFGGATFRAVSLDAYERWFEGWFVPLLPALKPTASIYVCGDWRSAAALQRVLSKHLILRNRITWEREKGRGARANWKNCSEDIWFGTLSYDYYFCAEAVKLKRRVLAPYRENGQPKDWTAGADGAFRLTHPSNIWTDLTVPYWSMKENTAHPTQKPEKLLAKIILASSRPGDCIFDPFLGSGTSAAVAVKLGRRFVGIEQDEAYCCLAAKRVALAEKDKSIQGYVEGVFWERNSLREQKKGTSTASALNPTANGR